MVTAFEEPVAAAGEKRMLALGDSYTIGESVDAKLRWPVQLTAALRKDGLAIAEPTIVARTGWTTGDLIRALDDRKLKEPYELVTLLIGVNNQYQRRELGEYREEFKRLLDRAISYAGGKADRVIVVSIPDWGVTPFAKARNGDPAIIAKAIDQFNDANREIAKAAKVAYIEITVASRDAAKDPKLLAGDGLHPSGVMYAQWAAAALPIAKKMLSNQNGK